MKKTNILILGAIVGLFFVLVRTVYATPSVSNVSVSGVPLQDQTFTGLYDYSGNESWTNYSAFGDEGGTIQKVSTAVDLNGVVYMAFIPNWSDWLNLPMVFKYTNGAYSSVGALGSISGSTGGYISLALENASGVPYVSFKDSNVGNKVTVAKYNGVAWVNIGDPGISDGVGNFTSLALNSSDVPYVAYQDVANGSKLTVMRYFGGSWEMVGATHVSDGAVTDLSLVMGSNDVPYVIYKNDSGEVVVKNYVNSSWTNVGPTDIGVGTPNSPVFALDANNRPVVAFINSSAANEVVVRRFNGTTWETVGDTTFSGPQASYLSLGVDSSDQPVVSYRANYNNSLTLKSYNGFGWSNLGSPREVVGEYYTYNSLQFGLDNDVYLFYNRVLNTGESYLYLSKYKEATPDPEDGSTYQWYRDGVPINGATSVEYVQTLEDDGFAITFAVTPRSQAGLTGETVYSSGVNSHAKTPPYIDFSSIEYNVPIVGQTFYGNYAYVDESGYNPEGESLYQWYRDSVLIDGANTREYVVSEDDVYGTLNFEVTPVGQYVSGNNPVISDGVYVPLVEAPQADNILVTYDTSYPGNVLHGSYEYNDQSGLNPENGTIIAWKRNDILIEGANDLDYTISLDDIGSVVSLEITPVGEYLTGGPTTSQGVSINIPSPYLSSVALNGSVYIGGSLNGSYVYHDDSGINSETTSTYRWLRNGSPIDNATSTHYILTAEDIGKTIVFEVTPVGGYVSGTPVQSSGVFVRFINPSKNTLILTRDGASSISESLSVSISSQPTSAVTLTPTLSLSGASFSTSSLVFSSENWTLPQTLVLSPVLGSGTSLTSLTFVTSSADENWNNLPASASSTIAVYIIDRLPSTSSSGGGSTGGCTGLCGGGSTATITVPQSPIVTVNPIVPPVVVNEVVTITSPAIVVNLNTVLENLDLDRDEVVENIVAPQVSSDVKSFKVNATPDQLNQITIFITYGVSDSTVDLGQGERRAVIRDYLDTVKSANIDWQDIERITNGEKPNKRNLESEKKRVAEALSAFVKITGHAPDFKDKNQDLAWNVLMYRIRFERDLVRERAAIAEFNSLFKTSPKTPQDWAIVRAIAYTGVVTK